MVNCAIKLLHKSFDVVSSTPSEQDGELLEAATLAREDSFDFQF